MRITLDLCSFKMAVQEWLYFLLLLSTAKQYPHRYPELESDAINESYQIVMRELANTENPYFDRIFVNTKFVKTLFLMISTKDVMEFRQKIYLVKIFQMIMNKFPDLKKWNFFVKRVRKLDFLMNMKCPD